MEFIEQAMQLKEELDKLRPIDKEREAIVMQKLRLDWDYHSNHLEGNSLTYGETKALILFGITAQGKPLKDHIEISGHDEAIKWITEIVKDDFPLTEKFIRELHILLLKEPHEKPAITPDGKETVKRIEVGQYKSVPNHVQTRTGEIFRFATPEETPAKMHDLINWYREKKELPDVNPIILAAEFHYRFVRIHPFDDGNGRIARILMNFILMQYGYPPAIIKTADRQNYFSALQQADSGIFEPFFEYIAEKLLHSLQIMIAGAKGESIEEPDDIDKEIALLEQKLKQTGKNVASTITKSDIEYIFDNIITQLGFLYFNNSLKFARFYTHSEFHLLMNNHIICRAEGFNESIEKAKSLINLNTFNISFNYSFIGLNQKGFENFGYVSMLLFEFGATRYKVRLPDGLYEIEKGYDELLTDKDCQEIIRLEMHKHKMIIEEKIKEIQNNK